MNLFSRAVDDFIINGKIVTNATQLHVTAAI